MRFTFNSSPCFLHDSDTKSAVFVKYSLEGMWMHAIEYDGKSLLGFDQSKSPDASQNDLRIQTQDQPNSYDQLSQPSLPAQIPVEHHFMNPGLTIGVETEL